MQFGEIKEHIEQYKLRGLKLFTTSSFQSHSIVLLHILSRVDNSIPVYFIDTGYHFPETLSYRDQIAKLLNLNLKITRSVIPKIQQRDSYGTLLFASDPDYCCHINKVQPMEPLLMQYDIWINGVRADQSAVRAAMKAEQKSSHNSMRFHPMLGWTNKMISDYLNEHDLPRNPLEKKGYTSIGCEPCTRKIDLDMLTDERHSRWFGMNKTECGLHTQLIDKQL